MKMCGWMLVAIIAGGIGLSFGPLVRVHNGFSTGEEFLSMSAIEQHGYAMGFLNGLLDAPVLGAPQEKVRWVADCATGMSSNQVREILRKYIKDHPERWHEPLNLSSFSALAEACPDSPTNRQSR